MKYWIWADADGTPRALHRQYPGFFDWWDRDTHTWVNRQDRIGLVMLGDINTDSATEDEANALIARWG
jgi:hypothetical protein